MMNWESADADFYETEGVWENEHFWEEYLKSADEDESFFEFVEKNFNC